MSRFDAEPGPDATSGLIREPPSPSGTLARMATAVAVLQASTKRSGRREAVIGGAADLLPQLVDTVVLGTVRDTHAAVAARVFDAVPMSWPVQVVHDGIAGATYGMLSAVTGGARAGAGALARALAHRGPEIPDTRAVRRGSAILNGVLGDLLEVQDNGLAISMAVRVGARDVPLTAASLATAFPAASSRLVVFLHGLVENDESWTSEMDGRETTYPDTVVDAGLTPVLIRYNSGRRISHNAADLSHLLADLVALWPVDVTELILVGHSMGGLVIRGAGEHARRGDLRWPELTSNVLMLGTPHTGAALERVANAGAWLLSAVPESAAFGAILRRRSVGIKDLRHGYVTDDDWVDADPDGWHSRRAGQRQGVGDAAHHNVAATLGPTDRHIASRALGDLMVHWGSGTGAGHEWARTATFTHLGSTNHFGLLNHTAVTKMLKQML